MKLYKEVRRRVILSVVFSMFVGLLTFQYLSKAQNQTKVVVPKRTIEANTLIKEEDLKLLSVNENDMRIMFPNAAKSISELNGAATRVRLEVNKPIQIDPEVLVFGEEVTQALNMYREIDEAYFIPFGKRLMAIEVDGSGSLNYGLRKGDYVDVIYTSKDDSTGGLFSSMIMQHVRIYDIEDMISNASSGGLADKKQKVLLMVTEKESLMLAVAKRNGVLDLTLNPLVGGEYGGDEPAYLLDIAGIEPKKKSDMLMDLEGYIREQDFSDSVKDQLINAIENERNVDALKRMIEASDLPPGKKSNLISSID